MNSKTLQQTVLALLGARPISFNPALARLTGSINSGLLLSQFLYWQSLVGADQWFWKSQKDITLETFLTRHETDAARARLVAKGVLEAEKREVMYYRVRVQEILNGSRGDDGLPESGKPNVFAENQQTGLPESGRRFAENRQTPCTPNKEEERKKRVRDENSADAERLQLSAPELRAKKVEVDPRHAACRDAYGQYAERHGVVASWGPAEGAQLKSLLDSSPGLTVERFSEWLRNRNGSYGVSHGEPPRLWLGTLGRYQQGPLNQFNKLEKGEIDGTGIDGFTGTALPGRSSNRTRTDGNRQALNRAIQVAERAHA